MIFKKGFHFIFLFILSVFFGCENSEFRTGVKTKNIPSKKDIVPLIIDIQPFDDIPEKYVNFVFAELSRIYPNVQLKKTIPLPQRAFYEKRKPYRADTLINYLRGFTPNGHVTLGMTSKDISTTKNEIKDYGVMGLGYQPGRSCVVSYFRLSKKEDVFVQFFKLSIHELGHTQGLPHCPVKTCFMRDAEGKNHTNEEKEFCTSCKTHLISRGWNF